MGCSDSKLKIFSKNRDGNSNVKITAGKVEAALLKKKSEHANDGHPMTFERILLKFEKMHSALFFVKTVYYEYAVDHSMNLEQLQAALTRLHGTMMKEEIAALFDFVDVDESHSVSLKEFLACLTIGHVLDAFPDLSREITEEDMKLVEKSTTPLQSPTITPKAFNAKAGNGSPKSNRVSVLLIKNNSEIKEMLNLITSAYLLFDDKAEGFIRKSSVEKMLEEEGHKVGGNAMLSQQKWKEMDWDANGTIDFAEFINSFTTWVDMGEDEDDVEEH